MELSPGPARPPGAHGAVIVFGIDQFGFPGRRLLSRRRHPSGGCPDRWTCTTQRPQRSSMQEGPAEEGGAGPHGQWSRAPVPLSGGAMCHWSTTFGSWLKPYRLRFAAVLRLELAARVRSRAEEDNHRRRWAPSPRQPPTALRLPCR